MVRCHGEAWFEGDIRKRSKSAVLNSQHRPEGAVMDADLDSLLTVVFCTADDLLPMKAGNARRIVTDAEVVTLAVAQVLLGYHDSDRRFLAAAERRLTHLFPQIPTQDAFHKRRARLEASIEWLIGVFAAQSPGYHDDMLVLDSTPVASAPLARNGQTRGRQRTGGRDRRRRRLRLQPRAFAVLLRNAPASARLAGRHPARGDAVVPSAASARSRSRCSPVDCTAVRP